MVTFEVLLNGKPLYTMDAGDLGSLHTFIHWCRVRHQLGKVVENSSIGSFAMNQSQRTHHYPEHSLKVGDEVTLRIVETEVRDAHITHPTWWK